MENRTTKARLKANLESVYGEANDSGWGSAVFGLPADAAASAEDVARQVYASFLGDKLSADTKSAWLDGFKVVLTREGDGDLIAELQDIADPPTKTSVGLLIEMIDDVEAAKVALSGAFNGVGKGSVAICGIGDGEAMNGIMVASHTPGEESLAVVALMD